MVLSSLKRFPSTSELAFFHVPGVPGDLLRQRTKSVFLTVTAVCPEVAEADMRPVCRWVPLVCA